MKEVKWFGAGTSGIFSNRKKRIVILTAAIAVPAVLIGCFGNLDALIGADVLALVGSSSVEVSVESTVLGGDTTEFLFPGVTLIDGDEGTGVSDQIEFTITNNGDLEVTGIAVSDLTGSHAGDFDLDTTGLETAVVPGSSTSFTVRFDPISDAGTLSANVTVATNETDNLSFTVSAVADWWGVKTVQSTSNVGTFTSIASEGEKVYIAFVREPDDDPWSYATEDLYLTVSENQGESWGPPVLIDDSSTYAYLYPSITVVNGTTYVSYLQLEQGDNDDLKFAKSLDDGLNWQNVQTILLDDYISQGWYSDIAVVGSTVYIASYDDGFSFENMGLLFVRSDNGGISFDAVSNAFNSYDLEYADWDSASASIDDAVGLYPSLAVSGSRVYIGYFVDGRVDLSDHVRVTVSIDNGETWDPTDGTNPAIKNEVDTPGYDFNSSSTGIAVEGSTVYFMYTDETTSRVMFARSEDRGQTWPPANIRTVDTATDTLYWADMAASGSNVYVAYYDVTGSNYNLKFNRSIDGGRTWSAEGIRLDGDDTGPGDVGAYLDIAAIGDSVYISYYDWVTGDLKFAKSVDGGVTW